MSGRLKGKIALITGASRGIGRAIAKRFAEEGAMVAINYNKSYDAALNLKNSIGKNAQIFKADVSKREDVKNMVKEVHERLGYIDILVNNAGVLDLRPFEEYDEHVIKHMFEVNLFGPIYVTLEFLEDLKKNRGVIINIASNAGIGTAVEGTTYYAITKAGIIILTKRLAFELGKYGIRVNAIAPGLVETDMIFADRSEDDIRGLIELFKSKSVLKMTGKPVDIANIAVFLASEESRYITGQIIVSDGGRIDNLTHSI